MAFGFPHGSAGHPGLMRQPSFGAGGMGNFGGQPQMAQARQHDLFMGNAGYPSHLSAGHPSPMSPMIQGRPRLLTSPAAGVHPELAGMPHQQQRMLPPPSLQDLYSPQTPVSPMEAQQARAMQMQQIQAARAARSQPAHPRSHTMSVQPGYPAARRGSFSMPPSPAMGGMHALEDDEPGFSECDGQMQYRPQMDDETAAYIRGASPYASQITPSHALHNMAYMFGGTGSGTHDHTHNDDFEVEQEVNVKTRFKGRGSMSGRAKGHGEGFGQFGMQGGMGGHAGQMGYPQDDFSDPRLRRAATPF